MLAFESSRQDQSYFSHPSSEINMNDPFAPLDMEQYHFGTNPTYAPASSYYDSQSFSAEAPLDAHKRLSREAPSLADPLRSSVSTAASIASTTSSAVGSPYSAAAHGFSYQDNWIDVNNGLGLGSAMMGNEFVTTGMDSEMIFAQDKFPDPFVDPSLIQPVQRQSTYPAPEASFADDVHYGYAQSHAFTTSPIPSPIPAVHRTMQQHQVHPHKSPLAAPQNSLPPRSTPFVEGRRSSISSIHSRRSAQSPLSGVLELDEDGKEKGRCPHPDCNRLFKDLKAHMLTHQSERPEKCPIVTCEYHLKGFARKYDKNRHTLTHYKGTMVCGFCPGSGSSAEKSFNRADVFKRHLTSVHGVEQTPPNCRKRSPTASSNRNISSYCQDATGKCSTCSATFSNAQDFYEHLDDCVLRVVQQEEPSEAINQQRLAEVADDQEVKQTMEKHMLTGSMSDMMNAEQFDDHHEDYDHDAIDDPTGAGNGRSGKGAIKTNKGGNSSSRAILGSSGAVSKPGSNSKTGANKKAPITKKRNNRNNYPPSWGCPTNKMKMKKRVLCVYDGPRSLWKDEMMLDNEFEVRVKLPLTSGEPTGRDAYVTDLDIETLKRAEGVLNATEEEKGPWAPETSASMAGALMGTAAMPVPLYQGPEATLDDFMPYDTA